jgi:hypothetical protein
MKNLFLIVVTFFCVTTIAQKPERIVQRNDTYFILYDNKVEKEILQGKGNSVIYYSKKNQYVLYKKLIKKSVLMNKEDGKEDASDMYSIYLFNMLNNKTIEVFKSCFDGNDGTKPSYANSDSYPFNAICNPDNFMLSPDEEVIYFNSKAWSVSYAIHYFNIKDLKLKFFHSGSLVKVDNTGVIIEITDVETVKENGELVSKGRYWQNCLYSFDGKFIKYIGEKIR